MSFDFGGCQAFVRVRFLHCAFIKKKRKIMHGFRNTQSSFSAFSFPLYFKKSKRAKENLELLNVHSYHPLAKVGYKIEVGTDHLYLESWENSKRRPCITYIYTMMNLFIIVLKQFVFYNLRTLVLMWWSNFESEDD
jgi:hypothetical protein